MIGCRYDPAELIPTYTTVVTPLETYRGYDIHLVTGGMINVPWDGSLFHIFGGRFYPMNYGGAIEFENHNIIVAFYHNDKRYYGGWGNWVVIPPSRLTGSLGTPEEICQKVAAAVTKLKKRLDTDIEQRKKYQSDEDALLQRGDQISQSICNCLRKQSGGGASR